jgi:hypothetical protein
MLELVAWGAMLSLVLVTARSLVTATARCRVRRRDVGRRG